MLGWHKDKGEESAAAPVKEPAAAARPAAPVQPPNPAMASPRQSLHPRLGDMLVQEGVVSQGQLAEALKRQAEFGGFIGQIMVEMNYISQATLVSFLVKQCKIPHISLVDYVVSEDLLKLVPKELCLKHHLLPIDKLGRILTLAMVDPLDVEALEQIRSSCPDLKIKPILCDWNHFESVAKKVFHTETRVAQEVTAGSFGLSAQKPKKPAAAPAAPSAVAAPAPPATPAESHPGVDAAVDALVKEAERKPARSTAPVREEASPAESRTPEAVRAVRPEPGPAAVAPTIQELRAALKEAVEPLLAAQKAAGSGDFAEKAGESIRSAMKEVIEPLLRAQQPVDTSEKVGESIRAAMQEMLGQFQHAQQQQAAGQADSKAVAEELRATLTSALSEALGPMVEAQKAASGPRQPTPEEWAKIVAAGMQTPLGALAAELRGLAEQQRQVAAASGPDSGAILAGVLREVLGEHESRLAQVAAAATQAAQAAETAVRAMQEAPRESLDSGRARTRIANLEVFPGADATKLDAGVLAESDALDSPGLGTGGDERVREALDSDRLLGGYTFDQFLAGPQNTFTVKAARALGEKLARDFNPFFLFGDEGLGKTHLLNAIGNAVLKRNPDLRVAYVSASHFAGSHAAAVKQDRVSEFRDRYCHWDMLLIDDVQFLAGHAAAQEELFHIFNALVHEGRLVVMAGDRPPDQLTEIQKGLVSRFSSGVVTRVRPPEMEIRLAILKYQAAARKISVPEEILTLIATRITSDVRKMTGALRKVLAYAKLVEQEITREMANEILDSLGIGEAA
ncbi:MAG: ATP-binding protein [Candidatus Hydrogenedentes bacterium]|nr:ATP-binding protein [Candidatus Hydrogenedentota bacterium]